MRKFASIPPRIWQVDLKSVRGNLDAMAVHYHLTTSIHANMLGLYYLPLIYLTHDLGCPLEGASKALQSLIQAGICSYDEQRDLVWVHDMASDQVAPQLSPKDKRVRGIAEQLAMLPICPITLAFYAKYRMPFHLHEERCLEAFEVGYAENDEAPSMPLRSKEKDKEKEKDLGEGKGPLGFGPETFQDHDRETMFASFAVPASAALARDFLLAEGVPKARLDECVRQMMGGNFSRYDLEGVLTEARSAAA